MFGKGLRIGRFTTITAMNSAFRSTPSRTLCTLVGFGVGFSTGIFRLKSETLTCSSYRVGYGWCLKFEFEFFVITRSELNSIN